LDTLTYNGMAPFAAGSDTSFEAAKAVTPNSRTVRARILQVITGRGAYGATQDEVSLATGCLHQSASARIRELVLSGHLVDSRVRRETRYGKKARVYVAA
jgi:hypothetical protein